MSWNYEKFLINRSGQAIARYKPAFTDFEADVSTTSTAAHISKKLSHGSAADMAGGSWV